MRGFYDFWFPLSGLQNKLLIILKHSQPPTPTPRTTGAPCGDAAPDTSAILLAGEETTRKSNAKTTFLFCSGGLSLIRNSRGTF